MIWNIDATFKCVSRVRDFYQCLIISITYESADGKKSFGYPIAFIFMRTKCQVDYEDVFHELNNLNLFYNPQSNNLSPLALSCDYEFGLIRALENVFPDKIRIMCHFHFNQSQNRKLRPIFGKYFTKHPVGGFVAKLIYASVFIDWSEPLIELLFGHLEALALEIPEPQKRDKYFAYLDYLQTYYFSDHKWTNVGNLFVLLSENGIKNFTNNQSEAINKQFGMKFATAPSLFENVLVRTKEFKKEYLIKKADTMGADRMRARPKAQLQRAERRETLMQNFHNLDENQKLIQLIETLEAISSA